MPAPPDADLVLEGGGVRGIALAGAVGALGTAGVRLHRIAGVSSGAVVGAVTAALAVSGESLSRVDDVLATLPLARFRDPGPVGRVLPVVGSVIDLLLAGGAFRGRFLREWLCGVLADLGVRTFGDLRLPSDPEGDLPPGHRYALLVLATDLSDGRLARLPWDYPDYGRDPDAMPVAAAVAASAAIPFYFRPAVLRTEPPGAATLVDGAVLSDYPIGVFDRTDGRPPRWPTIGVRLSGPAGPPPSPVPVRGPIRLGTALLHAVVGGRDRPLATSPCDMARSVFVPAARVSPVDFGLTREQQRQLRDAGEAATGQFLDSFDFAGYLTACRGRVP